MTITKTYEVALSFAGEDRHFVEQIAISLRQHNVNVFYDEFEKSNLWGKDLYDHLEHVYSSNSKYCIIFISKYYINKKWTNHELKSAQVRALSQDEYLLPIRLDDTNLPGIRDTIGYLDARDMSVDTIIETILTKLGRSIKNMESLPSQEDVMFWKIRSVINSDDPIGLFPDAPTDEYDPEVKEILQLLPQAKSPNHLAKMIHAIFIYYFSDSLAGPVSRYYKLSNEIWLIKDGYRVS